MEIPQEIPNPYFTQFKIMNEQIELLKTKIDIMERQIVNITKLHRLDRIKMQDQIQRMRGY